MLVERFVVLARGIKDAFRKSFPRRLLELPRRLLTCAFHVVRTVVDDISILSIDRDLVGTMKNLSLIIMSWKTGILTRMDAAKFQPTWEEYVSATRGNASATWENASMTIVCETVQFACDMEVLACPNAERL